MGTKRFACDGELLEASEETAFVAESGGVVVVRVAGLPVGNDDGARAEFADGGGEAEFVSPRGLDVGVGYAEGAAVFYFEDLCGERGFFRARFRGAERAHLTGGQVEDAGLVTGLRHFEERAAAGQFNIVGMSGDGEKVEVHFRLREVQRDSKRDW